MSDETALKWMEPQYPGFAFYAEYVTEQPHRWGHTRYPTGTRVRCWTDLNRKGELQQNIMIAPVSGQVQTHAWPAPSAEWVS